MHKHIISSTEAEPKRSEDAYHALNNEILTYGDNSGTTALTAFIEEKDGKPMLNLAWAGDSRAILIDKDGNVLAATEDHKPEAPQEAARIFKADGFIYTPLNQCVREFYFNQEELHNALEKNPDQIFRTIGGLSIARTIGDKLDKRHKNFIHKQMGTIPTPEVKTIELTPHATALIMACDGVWDVLSNQGAADFVSSLLANSITSGESDYGPKDNEIHQIKGTSETAKAIASGLRDFAYASESGDNISVLLVLFEWQQPIIIGDLNTILTDAQKKLVHDDAKKLVSGWIESLNAINQNAEAAHNATIKPIYEESLERYKENLMREDGTDDEILNQLYQIFDTAYHNKTQFAQFHLTELKDYLDGNLTMSDDSETSSNEDESESE